MSNDKELNKSPENLREMQGQTDTASARALHEILDKGAYRALRDMQSQNKNNCDLPKLSIGDSSGKNGDGNNGFGPVDQGGKRPTAGSGNPLESPAK